MILGARYLDWLACVSMCVERRWPDCNQPLCGYPCFPRDLPTLFP